MERKVREVDPQMAQARTARPATALLSWSHPLCLYSNFSL